MPRGPGPKSAVDRSLALEMYHSQVLCNSPCPESVPALAKLRQMPSMDMAFETLNEAVRRRFELWSDGVCLNPVQERKRTILSLGYRGILYIPPHVHDGELTNEEHIFIPEVVWMKRGDEFKCPPPHAHLTVRVIA